LFKHLQVVIPLMRNQDRALAPAMQHTLPVHDYRRGVVAVSKSARTTPWLYNELSTTAVLAGVQFLPVMLPQACPVTTSFRCKFLSAEILQVHNQRDNKS